MSTSLRRAVLVIAAVASVVPASAATLRTSGGGSVSVEPRPQLAVLLAQAPAAGFGAVGGLTFTVNDGSGRRFTGTVPGTEDLVGGAPIALGQSPLTRDVFLVFGRRAGADTQWLFSSWMGQWWSEPESLFRAAGSARSLVLAFSDAGDAVLTWLQDATASSVMFRHFELSPSGVGRQYAFQELGDSALYLKGVGGDVRLADGVAHAAVDLASGRAFVFVADPDADQVAVLALDVNRWSDESGIGAAPVPVILGREVDTQGSGSAGSSPALPSVGAKVGGFVIDPFRLEIESREVYYWLDADAIRGVIFHGHEALRFLSLPRPETDAEAHVALYQTVRRDIVGSERLTPSVLRPARGRLSTRR